MSIAERLIFTGLLLGIVGGFAAGLLLDLTLSEWPPRAAFAVALIGVAMLLAGIIVAIWTAS